MKRRAIARRGQAKLAHLQKRSTMTKPNENSRYALGNTDDEHERLAWQAERFDPLTERLFREAGIDFGQRVLDLGSGAGHVALLLSRLVGPTGEVVGVERDANSIAFARRQIAEAGLTNVTFTQSDVSQISREDQFDAAVGRFILMYIADPARVVSSLSRLVRPGGVIAFHEVTWDAFLRRCAHLPLCAAGAGLIHEAFQRTGANAEAGPSLFRVFQDAGLPAPIMTTDVHILNARDLTRWIVGILHSMRPQFQALGLSQAELGDAESLPERLLAEIAASDSVVGGPDLVGAWSRKPADIET